MGWLDVALWMFREGEGNAHMYLQIAVLLAQPVVVQLNRLPLAQSAQFTVTIADHCL